MKSWHSFPVAVLSIRHCNQAWLRTLGTLADFSSGTSTGSTVLRHSLIAWDLKRTTLMACKARHEGVLSVLDKSAGMRILRRCTLGGKLRLWRLLPATNSGLTKSSSA